MAPSWLLQQLELEQVLTYSIQVREAFQLDYLWVAKLKTSPMSSLGCLTQLTWALQVPSPVQQQVLIEQPSPTP